MLRVVFAAERDATAGDRDVPGEGPGQVGQPMISENDEPLSLSPVPVNADAASGGKAAADSKRGGDDSVSS